MRLTLGLTLLRVGHPLLLALTALTAGGTTSTVALPAEGVPLQNPPLASWGEAPAGSGSRPLATYLDVVPAPAPLQSAGQPEHYPNMYRRMGVSLGAAFYGNFDTTVQISGDAGVGALLDLEDLLGVDDEHLVARLGAFYSFSPRHRVDLGIFDISRDGMRTVGQDLQVGNVVIPAGEVETTSETLIVKAAYRYNFVTDARTAIGASFGLHTMGLNLEFESGEFDVSEKFRATAPLPVLGLHGEYALSERWKLLASAEVFQVDLGEFEGFLSDTLLAVEHDPFGHFGWGFAFNGFQLNAEIEDGSLTADMDYGYQGLMLYLRWFL